MFSSWLGWGRGGDGPAPAAQSQQPTPAQMMSNVPPPPAPSPGVSASVGELHRFVYERCGPDFSPDAVNELYAFMTVFSSHNAAVATSGLAIDGSRVYMAGSGPDTRALMIPLVPTSVSMAAAAPLLVRVAAAYKNPGSGLPPREAVVSINVPPAERSSFAVNPAAASFVDPESLVVLVPQRSSTLVNYARDIVARIRRTPPLLRADGPSSGGAGGHHAPAPSSSTSVSSGNPYANRDDDDDDTAASASPVAEQLLTTLRHAAESELGATAGRLDTASRPCRLELLLPISSCGRRAHVPIEVEVHQLAPGPQGGRTASMAAVPPLRSRVRPPAGCVLVAAGYESPCDAYGYVTRLDRAAAAEAFLQLASARTASAYLRELAAELGARFPYTTTGTANDDTYPSCAAPAGPEVGEYSAAGNPYGSATTTTTLPPDVEPYSSGPSSDDAPGVPVKKDSAPLPPPQAAAACVPHDSCHAEHGRPSAASGACVAAPPVDVCDADAADLSPASSAAAAQQQTRPVPSSQQQQQPPPAAAADDGDGDDACVICLDAPREYVCVPCGHRVLCEGCRANFPPGSSRCPTCRAEVQATMKVFL